MKLLIALVQTSGEDMILPTVQLLRVALVTRLLLLLLIPLIVITTLVALIALVAMSALITGKPEPDCLHHNPVHGNWILNCRPVLDHLGKNSNF